MKKIVYILVSVLLILNSCTKDEREVYPVVETISAKMADARTFDVTGKIIEVGSLSVLDYGFIYTNGYSGTENMVSLGKSPSVGQAVGKVPAPTSRYNYVSVKMYLTNTKGTVYGKEISFQLSDPKITSFSPTFGKPGDEVKIYGENFSPVASDNIVKLGNNTAVVTSAKENELIIKVPANVGAAGVPIYVYVGSMQTNTYYDSYFYYIPTITDFNPKTGAFGTTVTITGSDFSSNGTFYFDNVSAYPSTASSGQVTLTVPYSLTNSTPKLKYVLGNYTKEIGTYTILPPILNSVVPDKGFAGITKVKVMVDYANTNPNSYGGAYAKVKIGSVTPTIYSDNTIYIPNNLALGVYDASYYNGLVWSTQAVTFTVIKPEANLLSQTSNATNTQVSISGNFFDDLKISNGCTFYLKYNGASYYFSNTSVDNTSLAPKQKVILNLPKLSSGSYNLELEIYNNYTTSVKVSIPEQLIIP